MASRGYDSKEIWAPMDQWCTLDGYITDSGSFLPNLMPTPPSQCLYGATTRSSPAKLDRNEDTYSELCSVKVKRFKTKTNMNKRLKERQRRSKMTRAITELRDMVPKASKENQSVVVNLTVVYLRKLLNKLEKVEAENRELRQGRNDPSVFIKREPLNGTTDMNSSPPLSPESGTLTDFIDERQLADSSDEYDYEHKFSPNTMYPTESLYADYDYHE